MVELDGMLSIVMPAYNEEKLIYQSIMKTLDIVSGFVKDIELIAVNDGSKDNTRAEILRAVRKDKRVRIVTSDKNRGKGNAIISGVSQAEGKYIAFVDADLELNPAQLEGYLKKMLDDNADVVIGCKFHKESKLKYPFKRNKFGGYVGMGPYNTNEFDWLYRIWYNMLIRGNDSDYFAKYHNCTAYKDTIICDAWLNYNVFAEWYLNQLRFLNPSIAYDIDKDFLYPIYRYQTNDKKFYSPDTCLLIPHAINAALANFNMSQDKYETEEEYNTNKNKVKAQLHELAKHFWSIKALSADAYALIMMYEPDEWENLTDEDTDRIRKELHKKIRKNEL